MPPSTTPQGFFATPACILPCLRTPARFCYSILVSRMFEEISSPSFTLDRPTTSPSPLNAVPVEARTLKPRVCNGGEGRASSFLNDHQHWGMRAKRYFGKSPSCTQSYLPLNSCDDSGIQTSVLEETSPNGITAQTGTGSLCRRMPDRVESSSSRTGRRDPWISIGRSPLAKSMFFDVQGHARFRTPSHRKLALPDSTQGSEAKSSIHKIPFETVEGRFRRTRETDRRRSSRTSTAHPTPGHRHG